MKLKSMVFDADESPEVLTVEMTVHEAALMATMTGRLSQITADEVIPGGYTASNGIYDCLIGTVFNRYWENGIDGYKAGDKD